MAKQTGLRFFIAMAELYTHLATLHRARVEVATKWLQEKQLLPVAEPWWLEPHSTEWFAALEMWNPTQAAMTRIAIETAGGPNCCSVCGDDPARDYRLKESHRPPGGVDTLRLCDDCLGIRIKGGEPYDPIDTTAN